MTPDDIKERLDDRIEFAEEQLATLDRSVAALEDQRLHDLHAGDPTAYAAAHGRLSGVLLFYQSLLRVLLGSLREISAELAPSDDAAAHHQHLHV